ncbi:hypothetical protein ABKN59_009289 [Abortiporus biennis]
MVYLAQHDYRTLKITRSVECFDDSCSSKVVARHGMVDDFAETTQWHSVWLIVVTNWLRECCNDSRDYIKKLLKHFLTTIARKRVELQAPSLFWIV